MHASTFVLAAPDGVQTYVHSWQPEPGVAVRGVVVIAHGLAEHSARYARFAAALCGAGLAVYAPDHRGHGHTSPESEHGFFAEENGWQRVLDDLGRVIERARREHPGAPLVLFGHSMGTVVTLTWLMGHAKEPVAAVVLSGPTGKVGALLHAGKVAARVERARIGKHGRSKLLNDMAFGAYNKAFRPNRTEFDWLSKDPAEVDKYVADPWCGFVPSTQLWLDLLGAQIQVQTPAEIARLPRSVPIFVIAGGRDPVGGMGKQVRAWIDAARKVGLAVDDRLWAEGRHELLNEVEREDVTATVIAWISRHLGPAGAV